MAYDMGTSVGHVTLDITGVDDGVKKIQEDFDKVDATTASSISEVENYANTLMSVLSAAYQNVTQNSTAAQVAQQAYNAVLDANEQKMAEYANEVSRAEQNKVKATEHVLELEKSLAQATETRIAQEQRYAELRENLNVNNRTLISNMEKLNTDLEVERNLRKELNDALKNEDKAAQAVVKAKEKLEDVSVKASNAALQAQNKIATAEDKAAQAVLSNAVAYEKKKLEVYANVEKASIASVQKIAQTEIQAEQKKISDIEKAKINAQRDVEKANIAAAERAVEKEKELELNAINEETKIKENAVAKIEKAKIDAAQRSADNEKAIRQKAQTDIEKALIAQETKLQQTKIQEAEKGARQAAQIEAREREQATREAIREQERAAQEISDKQVAAFAIAAKAVDEVVNGVKRLAQELVNLSKSIVDIGSNFETSMAQVAATSGMTATDVSSKISDYQDLVDAAKEAGLTTIYSASEAGQALNYLALAGYNVEQSIATMPDILTIAAAGAMDLGRASDMVTDAMNALDLSVDDTSDFIDKMAKTAQSSNTNVEQLGNAILTVGGTATVLSGGVTELDTALGLLANAGIKARVGGTALRQILLNLTAPAKNGAEAIAQLGLEVFDAEGNMRPLKDIFSDLNDIMADFTDKQRMETLNAIFDKRQIRSATALMQAVGEKWDTLEAKINNANGAAERMAETMRSNLNGALNIAKSNLENIAITIYDGIVKNITELVTEAIPKFQELNEALASPEVQSRLKNISKEIKDVGLNLIDKVVKVIPDVIRFLDDAETHLQAMAIALSGLIVAFNADKIISGIVGIAGALNNLMTFVVQNPYAALAIVMAEVIALAIEMDNAITQQYKDMAAQVREETDLWKAQRGAVENVTDEWNSYLETQDDVVKDAESHAEAVKQLYYRYMNLTESGKDATLALEALKDEVPGLQAMLDEGKDSFEDITKAVDDYTEALLRSARAEAGKDLYIQAFETQSQAQKAYDDATQAVRENELALKDAEKAVEEYSAKFDDPNFAWDMDELERLKETRDALSETLEANKKAADDAKATLDDATRAMEKTETEYTEYVRGEAHARGELLIGETEGKRAAGAEYAKACEEANKQKIAAERKSTEDFLNEVDEMERKIAAEVEGFSNQDLLDLYSSFFDNQEWDIHDDDLQKAFKNYRSIQKKEADALKKQMEDEEKDRKKIADEAKKKRDEAEKEWQNSIKNGIHHLENLAKLEDWSSEQLASEFEKFREANKDYYDLHLDDLEDFNVKIKETRDKGNKAANTAEEKAAKEYIKTWEKGYDTLIKNAEKAYKALETKRQKFQDNLLKGVELYTQESGKVWNKFTQQYETDKSIKVSSKDMKEQLKELKEYDKVLDKLKTNGVSDELLTEIMEMSPDKGKEFAEALNKMSGKELKAYVQAYDEMHKKTDEMTSAYYAKELEKFDTEYMQPLKAYVSGDQSELKKAYETLGQDSVQGYLDGLQSKADTAEGETKKIYENCLQDVKEVLGIHSPSTEFYEIGVFTIEGFLNGIQSKAEQLANVFLSLGQKAGDAFMSAFKQTWEDFTGLMDGFTMPVSMVTPTFGTPVMAGGQMAYMGVPTTTTGLTKEDIVSAVQEALPSGDVVLTVDKTEFGKISRDALNGLAENSEMGLKV